MIKHLLLNKVIYALAGRLCKTNQWQAICFYKPAIPRCASRKLLWIEVAGKDDTLSTVFKVLIKFHVISHDVITLIGDITIMDFVNVPLGGDDKGE